MANAKRVVRNALLLTMSGAAPFVGWLAVGADGRLIAVEPGEPPSDLGAAEVIDAGGAFVAPGFVSAHSHLMTSGSRGLAMDLALYGWVDAMTRYTRHCDADDIYWCTLHGALDFLNNGITCAYDFTDTRLPLAMNAKGERLPVSPLKPLEYATAQIRAKVDAGLRFSTACRSTTKRATPRPCCSVSPTRRRTATGRRRRVLSRLRSHGGRAMVDQPRRRARRSGGDATVRRRQPAAFPGDRAGGRVPALEMDALRAGRRARAETDLRPFRAGDAGDDRRGRTLRLRDVVAADLERPPRLGVRRHPRLRRRRRPRRTRTSNTAAARSPRRSSAYASCGCATRDC